MGSEKLLRIYQILGRQATHSQPAIEPRIPVCKSTWWEGVRTGRYPQPIRISSRCVAWRASDIAKLIDGARS